MADPKEKQLLARIAALTEENNRLLRKMRTLQIVGRVISIVYWLVILGFGVGLYYFIQPYLLEITEAYNSVQGGIQDAQDAVEGIPGIFDRILP